VKKEKERTFVAFAYLYILQVQKNLHTLVLLLMLKSLETAYRWSMLLISTVSKITILPTLFSRNLLDVLNCDFEKTKKKRHKVEGMSESSTHALKSMKVNVNLLYEISVKQKAMKAHLTYRVHL